MSPRGVTAVLPHGDDRAMAEYWGRQCLTAIAGAAAGGEFADLNAEHAERCARMAAWRGLRALRVKPLRLRLVVTGGRTV